MLPARLAAGVGMALLAASSCQVISGADEFTFAAGGAASTSSTSSQGGGGGPLMALCESPEDCPGVETTCQSRTCDEQMCGSYLAPALTECDEDDGRWCNGQGRCVQCFMDTDCDQPIEQCAVEEGRCIPAACADSTLNGEETDIDCGGSQCLPCPLADRCHIGTDCESGYCEGAAGGGGAGGMGGSGGAMPGGSGICTACGELDDCREAPNTWCDQETMGGTCVPQLLLGDACVASSQCGSGHCQDSVCCEEACNGTCEGCAANITGQPDGQCRAIPNGQDPADECFWFLVCDGSRNCRL